MEGLIHEEYYVNRGDYVTAGSASADMKRKLRQLGVSSLVLRRLAVASYEVELNLVIHSLGGKLVFDVDSEGVTLISTDKGPGIPDIEMAMKEGYSTANDEARSLGFGAGMGLPNMKKYTDSIEIETEIGVGTTVTMHIRL